MAEKQKKTEEAVRNLRERISGELWMTLGDWLDLWYTEYVEQTAARSTADLYLRVARDHIPPSMGELPVRSLSGKDIDDYIAARVREGAAPGAVDQYVTVLGAALSVAVQCGLAEQNPCRLSRIRLMTKQKREPEIRILTGKEQKRLERSARPGTADLGALIILHTGLKIGELLGLRWEDVSLERGELRIERILQRVSASQSTSGQGKKRGGLEEEERRKTEVTLFEASSPRTVTLTPVLVKELGGSCKALKGGGEGRGQGFVLNGDPEFETFFEPRRYQKYLRDQGREAGIEDLTCSVLRDTYAAEGLRAGKMTEVKNNLGISMASLLRKYEGCLETEGGLMPGRAQR
ncbi:tyrosine-type recombinase/integrase [Bacilliculturomica massiliensis]|uniref:tyrosine-type recombinase/integrase n=1 Tax=Bacilliculturomica massiliensis TaxID=1917867 RepID=UPI0010303D2C|nr:site-specific integrase [Bacilliculturomica massiliensis]